MSGACLILIAFLCLPWSNSRIDIAPGPDRTIAHVRYPDGEVEIELSSGDALTGFWSAAARRCVGKRCLDYRRADAGAATNFIVRRPDCDVGRRITIRGRDEAARDRLLDTLAILPPHGEWKDSLLLADLRERRPVELPEADRIAESARPANLNCTD